MSNVQIEPFCALRPSYGGFSEGKRVTTASGHIKEKERKKKKGKKKKEELRKQQKAPNTNLGKGSTWEKKPHHQKRKRGVSEDQEGCGQTS